MTNLLEGFETWLRQQPPLETRAIAPDDGPDLSTLLREFIALRQEINLLTRAARTQQEQNAETLRELVNALEALRQSGSDPAPDTAGQVNLKQLVEVRDALGRAEHEMQRANATLEAAFTEAIAPDAEAPLLAEMPPIPVVPGWLGWFGVRGPDVTAWKAYAESFAASRETNRQNQQAAAQARQTVLSRVRQIVASLLEGYAMSTQRVERLLQAHDLEAIPTVGQRFDPERMEALETVSGTGRPTGEVIEEVRRGYTQGGRIFRFALVRVARDG